MEVLADMLALSHSLDNLLAHITRMARHIVDALHAGNFVHATQQLGKSILLAKVLAIGVNVLSQQRKFLIAVLYSSLNLAHDILYTAATLTATHVRHDAVGAEVIAAVHNGNPRSKRALAYHMAFKLALVNRQISIGRTLALSKKLQQQTLEVVDIGRS